VWSTKRFRRQAATCAALAKQTHDEESRQRYLRLEQTYLHLAETKDQLVGQISAFAGERNKAGSLAPTQISAK
jgi:hypothetical protein